ncbi:acyloxyacyl hydrolase [Desulfosediminicola flagellatus]|uniref:acyloxyacyl hydrolase n=1 Tax=Desulfosediminicola flagellatus TaxID=2569541 RepID=UPI0010AB63D8|nr:acyloxyacyl hydrolase [Desulfosediminicola flagellatus]
MICLRRMVVVVLCISFSCIYSNAMAASLSDVALGVRVATNIDDEDFTQYEVFGAVPLPWRSHLSNGWEFETMLDLSIGVMEAENDTGGKFTAAVDALFYSPDRTLSLVAAMGIGVMTREVYDGVDFAGPVFFRFQGGLNYWLNQSFSVGYRFLHESNGSMYDKNPSLNMHQFEMRVHF